MYHQTVVLDKNSIMYRGDINAAVERRSHAWSHRIGLAKFTDTAAMLLGGIDISHILTDPIV